MRRRRIDGLLGLLVAVIAALVLIPDRYTVPLIGGLGLRPYQIVLTIGLGVALLRAFHRGRPLSVGRSALLVGLLVVVAVASAVDNLERLSDDAYLAAIRLIVTLILYAVLAVAVAAVVSTPTRRRFAARRAGHARRVRRDPRDPREHDPGAVPAAADPAGPRRAEGPDTVRPDDHADHDRAQPVARPAGLAANPLELSAVMSLDGTVRRCSSPSRPGGGWRGCGSSALACSSLSASCCRSHGPALLASVVMIVVALLANIRRPRMSAVRAARRGCPRVHASPARAAVRGVAVRAARQGRQRRPEPRDAAPGLPRARRPARSHPWLGRGPQAITTLRVPRRHPDDPRQPVPPRHRRDRRDRAGGDGRGDRVDGAGSRASDPRRGRRAWVVHRRSWARPSPSR